jgi:hypothetical protein
MTSASTKRLDRMLELALETADGSKPQGLPEAHRTLIRSDDEIELHCSVAPSITGHLFLFKALT